jgi:hypothetical protein
MADTTVPPSASSVEVRAGLVDTLCLDLIGPDNDHPFANELLPESPTKWYLTGFLVPTDAPITQKFDETSPEEIDSPAEPGGIDDDTVPDRQAASVETRRSLLPSSIGMSFLVPLETKQLKGTVMWGDYAFEGPSGTEEPTDGMAQGPATETSGDEGDNNRTLENADDTPKDKQTRGWRRTPRNVPIILELPEPGSTPVNVEVKGSGKLMLVVTTRPLQDGLTETPAKAVSVFLVNSRQPDQEKAYRAFAFQATLEVTCEEGFVPRPDPRVSTVEDDWDQRVAELQYRDTFEYAVGHGVSVQARIADGKSCKVIRTTWIPTAEVERVAATPMEFIELGMEALGQLASGGDAKAKLLPLVKYYRAWIEAQKNVFPSLTKSRKETAEEMLHEASFAAGRIEAGIELLSNPDALKAFKIANRAIARSARQRFGVIARRKPEDIAPLTWRPFQLAFILMTLRSIVDPEHADRDRVDLLFFPTGGGKTEAYLGLAAFTLVYRRLKNAGIRSAGMSVLMRYTLRLLTLDQLGRAAGLICALELERHENPALGSWPFEIGLWVGQGATPNRMGHRGDSSRFREYTAYTKTTRFQRDDKNNASPIPLENCPWCGAKFDRNSFRLVPTVERPSDLRVQCANHMCTFTRDRTLPIVAVDEPIYHRLPCFLIATVDKFASLPWTGETGTLFGKVDRYDQNGFYGPCHPGIGSPIPDGHLPPPDLIIQDELHLISGPLGTIAGLYETVIDTLSTRQQGQQRIRPKIVASTATVRRAETQIRALFERSTVSVFPPSGPNRRDSFFAQTLRPEESPARLYIGVAAQGRSLKVVLLRTALALLSGGQSAWQANGAAKNKDNSADAYMTLLGYFNSLRELGGSRRIIEDEVRTRLAEYGRRRRREPGDQIFRSRTIYYDAVELTSRVSTNDVATAKRRLSLPFHEKDRVDVALATNMISVGLDIGRLGLMVVLGQPKTCSEYIQATSRVGRVEDRPGLVVALLNIHRPRDRSHYERFTSYHSSFYRNVEATSVTPFSPRALDRSLPAALIAMCRQTCNNLTPPQGANQILKMRDELETICQRLAERARNHRKDTSAADQAAIYANILHRCNSLLDDWFTIARQAAEEGSAIQYQREEVHPPRRLLYDFLDPDLPVLHPIQRRFRANRSMRDVEPPVEIYIKNLNDWGDRE